MKKNQIIAILTVLVAMLSFSSCTVHVNKQGAVTGVTLGLPNAHVRGGIIASGCNTQRPLNCGVNKQYVGPGVRVINTPGGPIYQSTSRTGHTRYEGAPRNLGDPMNWSPWAPVVYMYHNHQ